MAGGGSGRGRGAPSGGASSRPNPLLEAAIGFARRGWPVFPCDGSNKRPLLAADKDPETGRRIQGTGGLSKASTDPEKIEGWWRRWPMAMIGVATGHERLFVVDFDPRVEEETDPETGEVIGKREWTLEQLKADTEALIGCALPPTLAARTQSGGVHLYYTWPDDGREPIRNSGNLPRHVDVRGEGGYVIAPPSFMANGNQYRWLRGAGDLAIAEAPPALVEALRSRPARQNSVAADQAASTSPSAPAVSRSREDPASAAVRKYALSALDEECAELAKTPRGGGRHGKGRNFEIYTSAIKLGSLVAAGALSESAVRAALQEVIRGMPENEDPAGALQTLENGLAYGLAHPRDLREIEENARQRASRPASSAAPRRPDPPSPSPRDEGLQSSRAGSERGDGGWKGSGGAPDGAGSPNGGRPGDGPGDPTLERRCAFMPQTDLGNLERFLARYGEDFLFVEAWGWLAWDGRRWNREMAVPLLGRAVQRTMRAIQDEARFVRESGWKEDEAPAGEISLERPDGLDFIAKWKGKEPVSFSATIAAWGRTSESSGHISCIPKMAEARLAARTEDFDADPLMLNVLNGTIEFRRPENGAAAAFEKREHRREDRMTKIAGVAFDPEAACPLYDAFLEEVQPDPEMREFLDVWAGYNALGLADAQKFALFYGVGSNGKGVWINTHASILGDYAWSTGIETFIDSGKYRKGSDASPDLAALAGRRMVYANEPEEGSKFSDGLIKELTSDEPKGGVRELMKPPFELQITFTNTVSANHMPRIGTDHGIQRRVQVVPWAIVIPDERADPLLKAKLKAEGSGILNRMVRGALHYLTSRLPTPQAIKEATRQYHEENDILGQFIELAVERAPGERIGASELHGVFAAWQTWAQLLPATGKPWSAKHLNGQMQKKGFVIQKSSTMQWLDIALRYHRGDFVDDQGNPVTRELRKADPPDGDAQSPPPEPSAWGDDDDLPDL